MFEYLEYKDIREFKDINKSLIYEFIASTQYATQTFDSGKHMRV
jgi:hypothetical protein